MTIERIRLLRRPLPAERETYSQRSQRESYNEYHAGQIARVIAVGRTGKLVAWERDVSGGRTARGINDMQHVEPV